MLRTSLLCLVAAGLGSCAPARFIKIVDKSPTDYRKVRRADISPTRAGVGISFWGSREASKRDLDYERKHGDLTKAGMIRNWGPPDKSYSKDGIDYLAFMPEKIAFEPVRPGPTILGFKSNELNYIEAWDLNNGFYGDRDILVIP